MADFVAKIEQKTVNRLLADKAYEWDIVVHKYGFWCTNLADAMKSLDGDEYDTEEWIDYENEMGEIIGIPKPKKPRK